MRRAVCAVVEGQTVISAVVGGSPFWSSGGGHHNGENKRLAENEKEDCG